MTGKEALNLLFCTSEGLPEYKVYECQKILQQDLEKLTKYKRAFEILKEKGLHISWLFETKVITQEEYELLEELMKDE